LVLLDTQFPRRTQSVSRTIAGIFVLFSWSF
jgi:hypothetical protein